MSLSTKLTLALSTLALLVVAMIGAWQLRAEEEELRTVVVRDARLLGRSLQVAFENALRDRQSEDLVETLRAIEGLAPDLDIFAYDARGRLIASSTGASERGSFPSAALAHYGIRFVPPVDSRRLELFLPLRFAGSERQATLALVLPLDGMRRDLDATRARVISTLVAFVLAVAVLTMLLSRFWIARPLAQMNAYMRRVRSGDLSPGDLPVRADEVGRTLAEFQGLVDDLRETRARLEREAEQRRKLEQGLREVDKLATVGQLAAGVAHEIGSPLQVLEGRIAGLAAKAEDPGEVRRIAGLLLEHTRRITRIVSRLTGLARRRAPRMVAFDVAASVRAVVDLLEVEARRRGVRMSLEVAYGLPSIVADADQLQQVALNLVRNALDASNAGGNIVVRIEHGAFADASGAERHCVRVAVADDGRGMSDETRARIFEPFFTTRAHEGGTGLGLAVVAGIVADHEGRIEVDSAPGHGARFTVDLPVRAELQGEPS